MQRSAFLFTSDDVQMYECSGVVSNNDPYQGDPYSRSEHAVIGTQKSQKLVCTNITKPTNVFHITGLENGKIASGIELPNIICMIFGMHTFCTTIIFIKY